jgi:HPt (histidine-containing phosphotransfer) domain-containing protein
MTAYAVKGDRERCFAAGMDEYVAKPISAKLLFETINGLFPADSLVTADSEPDLPSVDRQSLIKAFDHDWSLFEELVEIFCDDAPQMLSTLRQSAQAQDAETLSRAAHSLKGMLRNFKAESAADTALELEKMGKANELQNVGPLIEKLEEQISGVDRFLKALVSQNG